MIIKPELLATLKKNVKLKNNLCLGLRKSWPTMDRWIKENIEDGPLTTIKAVEIIKRETGLTEDQILQRETIDSRVGLSEYEILQQAAEIVKMKSGSSQEAKMQRKAATA